MKSTTPHLDELLKAVRLKMERDGVSLAMLSKIIGMNDRAQLHKLLDGLHHPRYETGKQLEMWLAAKTFKVQG